jgi:hypothetical protein
MPAPARARLRLRVRLRRGELQRIAQNDGTIVLPLAPADAEPPLSTPVAQEYDDFGRANASALRARFSRAG